MQSNYGVQDLSGDLKPDYQLRVEDGRAFFDYTNPLGKLIYTLTESSTEKPQESKLVVALDFQWLDHSTIFLVAESEINKSNDVCKEVLLSCLGATELQIERYLIDLIAEVAEEFDIQGLTVDTARMSDTKVRLCTDVLKNRPS